MHAIRTQIIALLVISALLLPVALVPFASAWEAGDEEAIFGHTFAEEYWTNSSIPVETENATASLTASYVGVGEFSAFMIAFNEIDQDGTDDDLVIPYQLFGMHYKTPEDKEVFIGAIFAFLLAHNESYGGNNLPDVGNEQAWYVVPMSRANFWPDVTPSVTPIPAEKLGDGHYRFGMRYQNLPARIVVANTSGFWATLLIPVLTVLISELVIEYDITIGSSGEVSAETLYTLGQVERLRWFGLIDQDPREVLVDSMKISAVHYLSIFTSNYNVTRTTSGNTVTPPTATEPLDEDISIKVGTNNERAFDIGLGREYALVNESTDPWTTESPSETALNCLLGARASDFLLIAWQAPLSAWIFAHMAYGLSSQARAMYASPAAMAANAGTAFHNSQWWYAVTFPEWNGLRIEQDPTYVAYTNLALDTTTTSTTTPPPVDGGDGIFGLVLLVGIAAVVIILIRRRR
ncbi:MAG: hypothetical protein ACFFD6_02175 [Candidatus Thorarchaeota archaeon]